MDGNMGYGCCFPRDTCSLFWVPPSVPSLFLRLFPESADQTSPPPPVSLTGTRVRHEGITRLLLVAPAPTPIQATHSGTHMGEWFMSSMGGRWPAVAPMSLTGTIVWDIHLPPGPWPSRFSRPRIPPGAHASRPGPGPQWDHAIDTLADRAGRPPLMTHTHTHTHRVRLGGSLSSRLRLSRFLRTLHARSPPSNPRQPPRPWLPSPLASLLRVLMCV